MQELLLKYNRYAVLLLCFFSSLSHAGLLLDTNRVIMGENNLEKTMIVVNTNDYPVVMQTWVTNENSNALPGETKAPFIVLPVMAKLQPREKKRLKIYYSDNPAKSQIEKLYLLNLHEVPPVHKSDKDRVIVSMTTQIKLFFRPALLEKGPKQPLVGIMCQRVDKQHIEMTNNTPFYFNYVKINDEGYSEYLSPYEHRKLSVKENDLNIDYINDDGGKAKLLVSCHKQ